MRREQSEKKVEPTDFGINYQYYKLNQPAIDKIQKSRINSYV